MPVYIIRAGEFGPVKIGFAHDVQSRLSKMQADNHEALTVIRVLAGSALEESTLHSRFAGLRLRGEWFAFSQDMLGDLGIADMEIAKAPADDITSVRGVIRILGGPVALARTLNIDKRAPITLHWARRGFPSRYWHRIATLLGENGYHVTISDIQQMSASAA